MFSAVTPKLPVVTAQAFHATLFIPLEYQLVFKIRTKLGDSASRGISRTLSTPRMKSQVFPYPAPNNILSHPDARGVPLRVRFIPLIVSPENR